MSNFTLHLEESDRPAKGRAAFTAPTGVAVWAIGPLRNREDWSWALRYANRDGVPIVTEMRIIPTEEIAKAPSRPWEWSRETDAVPGDGLPFTPIHNQSFRSIDNQVRQALADHHHPAWPGHRDSINNEPPDHYLEWLDTTTRSGIDQKRTASPQRPGRPPLSDAHLAEVALHYTTALGKGLPTGRYILDQMRVGDEHLPVDQWVWKARKQGFLTPPPVDRRPGGHLTDRAIAVIAEHGLESPKPVTDERNRK